jgi:hypothetical protein
MTDQYEIRTTGETAPAGKYYCDKCGLEYVQKEESQDLPNCPAEGIWTVWNPTPLKTRTS